MLARFTRRRQRSPRIARRWRLSIERLEARDCPSLFIGDGPTPPVILGFSAAARPGHIAYLSGTVDDAFPTSVTVTFGGAAGGSAICDIYGHFGYATSNANLGSITAIAVNGQGLSSGPAVAVLLVPPPTLTLSVTPGPQRTVTLSGQVTDVDTGGLTVSLSGVASGSAVTRADGTFSLTTQASTLGNVQAITTDLWGLTSIPAQAAVSSVAPLISGFSAFQGDGNWWTFTGSVTDESAAGLVVRFGGISALSGQSTTVLADGTFTLSVQLQSGVQGTATAQTTDWWGLNSNTATDWIAALSTVTSSTSDPTFTGGRTKFLPGGD